MTVEQRESAAQRLLVAKGRDRTMAARMAEGLEVSAHWLRTLRRRLERGEEPGTRGRPRCPDEERRRVRGLVREQFDLQGVVGWRGVLAGIRETGAEKARERPTSTMLVQQETAAEKKRRRVTKRRALDAARVGHEVLARDAVWAEDSAHVGRLGDGSDVEAEMATDRATTATVIASVGPPVTGEDIRALLEAAKAERGGLPLVWQSDCGSANTSAAVSAYLEANQVIHLRSRVHTPTDNPVAERKNREVKEESGLGRGVRLGGYGEAQARLEPARRRIDRGRLRASRGWKTAETLDRELPRADTLVPRARFYEETCSAMKTAVLGLSDAQALRKAEQDAAWRTLEKYGVAQLRVGLRRTPCPRLAAGAPERVRVKCPGGQPG